MENGSKNVQRVWKNIGIANWRIWLFKRWRPIYSAYIQSLAFDFIFPLPVTIIC